MEITKESIRKLTINRRNELSDTDVRAKSSVIFEKLLLLEDFKRSSLIMCYVDFRNEVATRPFIEKCLKQGKRIAVPMVVRCQGGRREIAASEIIDMEGELEASSFGILEPKKEFIRPVSPESIDLAVIPGVAFDVDRNRIGYGAGFYDRFLKKLGSTCPKIAVAFDFQVYDRIPVENHDLPVSMIITEERII